MRFCDTEESVLDMIKHNDEYGEGYSNSILFKDEIEELEKVLYEKESSFESWKFTSKNRMAEIEEKRNELTGQNILPDDKHNYFNW